MLDEELSRALSDISDDKIEAAASIVPQKGQPAWIRLVAVAAVVVLILAIALWPRKDDPGVQIVVPTTEGTTAPVPTESQGYELVQIAGVLKMYSCNQENLSEEELKQYEVTDTVNHYDDPWIEGIHPALGIRFTFQLPDHVYEDADIRLKLYTPYGVFAITDMETGEILAPGKNAEARMNNLVSWHPHEDVEALKESKNPGPLYLRILIYADDRIVGFGLVELGCNYILDGWSYAVNLMRFVTVCYPKVDGQFQDVTEAYIMGLIEEYEQSMTVEYMECNEKFRVDFGEE